MSPDDNITYKFLSKINTRLNELAIQIDEVHTVDEICIKANKFWTYL